MPTDNLEDEMRDLFARILEAGRGFGEAAATDRVLKAVRAAAGHNSPLCRSDSDQATGGLDPTPAGVGEERQPPPISARTPTGVDRLPPYWRPR